MFVDAVIQRIYWHFVKSNETFYIYQLGMKVWLMNIDHKKSSVYPKSADEQFISEIIGRFGNPRMIPAA